MACLRVVCGTPLPDSGEKTVRLLRRKGMNKNNYRDYVTEAYRYYAMCGKPDSAALRQVRTVLPPNCRGSIADLEAVARVLDRLEYEEESELMKQCLDMVYFADPRRTPGRGVISSRVGCAAVELSVSESTVYRILRRLRLLLAVERGLRVEESELKLLFERVRDKRAGRLVGLNHVSPAENPCQSGIHG